MSRLHTISRSIAFALITALVGISAFPPVACAGAVSGIWICCSPDSESTCCNPTESEYCCSTLTKGAGETECSSCLCDARTLPAVPVVPKVSDGKPVPTAAISAAFVSLPMDLAGERRLSCAVASVPVQRTALLCRWLE